MTSTTRPVDDTDAHLREGADHLQQQFARGTISASEYRQRLIDLKRGPAKADTTPPTPPTRYRPTKRTAEARAPRRRETR